jgi:uncharacterized peroxidase-related enzyme
LPFIKVIDETDATGKLKEAYQAITKSRGKLSNIMKIHSLLPDAMLSHIELYKTIMFSNSNLSRELNELIAVVVSTANKCAYCINHHAEALNFYWKDADKIKQLINDYNSIGLDPKIKILLDYANQLTLTPNDITQSDVDKLKSLGWNDEDILSANLVVSYFNFVNRIALGLGVEFSENEIKGYKY